MRVSGFGRGDDFLVGCILSSVADVFHDGTLEQPGILKHHSEVVPQIVPVKITDIVSVQGDAAAVHVVEAHQQLYHGGLAGARGTDDGDALAGLHLAVEVMDDDLFRIIAELHMLEGDVAVQMFKFYSVLRCRHLFLCFEEVEYTLGRRGHHLQHVAHLGHLLKRLGEITDILDKGLNVADLDGSGCSQNASADGDAHISQVSDKHDDGLHKAAEQLGLPGGFVQLFVGGVEGLDGLFLTVIRLDHVLAAVVLLHLSVDLAQIILLVDEMLLGMLHDKGQKHHRDGQDDQGDQGHQRADGNHHHQHADQGRDRGDQSRDTLAHALPQRIHVVGDSGKHVADLS